MVIKESRAIAEVAGVVGVNEQTLRNWVAAFVVVSALYGAALGAPGAAGLAGVLAWLWWLMPTRGSPAG